MGGLHKESLLEHKVSADHDSACVHAGAHRQLGSGREVGRSHDQPARTPKIKKLIIGTKPSANFEDILRYRPWGGGTAR